MPNFTAAARTVAQSLYMVAKSRTKWLPLRFETRQESNLYILHKKSIFSVKKLLTLYNLRGIIILGLVILPI